MAVASSWTIASSRLRQALSSSKTSKSSKGNKGGADNTNYAGGHNDHR